MAKLQITKRTNNTYEILIDGKPMYEAITAIDIHMDSLGAPTATFTMPFTDGIEVDIDADIIRKQESHN